jgi:ubiquinone/menaquinone biosynthesis C-methylase UbiE
MFHPQGPTFLELARQALSSTQRGYDLLASKFDYTPFRTDDTFLKAFQEKVSAHGPYDEILDVCCGTGAAMLALLPICRQRIVGLDMSAGMLRQARKNLDNARKTAVVDCELEKGNALEMNYRSRFDLAVSLSAFGHILESEEQNLIDHISRALKPGGWFAFITTTMPSMRSSSYWMARGFNAAMHIRNWLVKPPFVMYYLTFLWPAIDVKLRRAGFTAFASDLFSNDARLALYKFVAARKSA